MNPMSSADFMKMHHREFENGAVWEDLFKTLRNREMLEARVRTLEEGINWLIEQAKALEDQANHGIAEVRSVKIKTTPAIREFMGRAAVARTIRTMAQAVKDGKYMGVDLGQPGTEQTIIHDGKGNNV